MPNHVHGAIEIVDLPDERGEATRRGTACRAPTTGESIDGASIRKFVRPQKGLLGTIIRSYKSAFTRHVRKTIDSGFAWQRNYYERIVRDEDELEQIR